MSLFRRIGASGLWVAERLKTQTPQDFALIEAAQCLDPERFLDEAAKWPAHVFSSWGRPGTIGQRGVMMKTPPPAIRMGKSHSQYAHRGREALESLINIQDRCEKGSEWK
jgi:hypothetical protein